MRQGQQSRRGRNRGGRKPQNVMSRNYESSGPDVKIRGTAMHIAEKYGSLARDAMSSGDTVAAENYLQHAEHYNRIILAAQAQQGPQGVDGQPSMNGGHNDAFGRDLDGDDDGDGDDFIPHQRQIPERTQDRRSYNQDRPERHQDRPERAERPSYNQHQQPQPYVPQNAFPQLQPQSIPAPVHPAPVGANGLGANGADHLASAETNASVGPDGDRLQRRRRRRPMGEGQARPFARNGNGGGQPSGEPTTTDEAAS